MKKFKIIISFVLIFAMGFSLSLIPSYASYAVVEEVGSAFAVWLLQYAGEKSLDWLIDKAAGEKPEDHVHNWERLPGIGGSSDGPMYALYRCSTCGEEMKADANSLHDAYNQYVDELPATGYNSGGGLLMELTHDGAAFRCGPSGSHFCCDHGSGIKVSSGSYSSSFTASYNCDSLSLSVYPASGKSSFGFYVFYSIFSAPAPIDGFYNIVDPIRCTGALVDRNASYRINAVDSIYSGLGVFYKAGDLVSDSFYVYYSDITSSASSSSSSVNSLVVFASAPKVRITPADSIGGQINLTYAPSTRVTNITGDVAYYDVNGTLQLAPNINIVNEGNKTYYNPVTNTTNTVNNWTYDYSDRSYTLELNTGDTVNVTYGDEYIRIEEDNRVYNVYYVTNNTTLPEIHTHEWYQTGAAQATCTEYGTKTYTCYICNEQKTEVLPALGHAWVQSGRVDAIVDEEGNETEAAHILYVCSRCGEEYKDYDGVGPPAPPEDPEDNGSGILAWLKEFKIWLGGKLDKLTGGDTVIDNDYSMTYVDEDGEEQEVKVKDIADKFGWWKQVVDIGETFVSQVSASEAAAYAYSADGARAGPSGAPSIPLDLSRAQSYYGVDYGGEIEMLDLSWYTPYKKTVDDLISGFLWLFFLWSLFKRVPAIVAGEGLVESRLSELRSSGSGPSSSPDVPLLPSKRKGG